MRFFELLTVKLNSKSPDAESKVKVKTIIRSTDMCFTSANKV
jgi:hypothetical protein